jgi:hypothetical protein
MRSPLACLLGLLASLLPIWGCSTPPTDDASPASAPVVPSHTVEPVAIAEVQGPEPPPPRLLGPPSSWRILSGSGDQPLATRVAMRDALGCGIWLLDGGFLEPTHDEVCEPPPSLGEPPWDRQKANVGNGTRTLWTARIEGNRFEGPNLRGSTKRGRYRALDFGVQVTTWGEDENLGNGLALLVESERGELVLELWNLGSGKRIAEHPISRGDAPGQADALVGAWVHWSELSLGVVLDLRSTDARRIRVLGWPDRDAPPLVREFPPPDESANVVGLLTDHNLIVVELERDGVREIQAVSLERFEHDPIVVPHQPAPIDTSG